MCYVNYMKWNMDKPEETPFESYLNGTVLLTFGIPLKYALFLQTIPLPVNWKQEVYVVPHTRVHSSYTPEAATNFVHIYDEAVSTLKRLTEYRIDESTISIKQIVDETSVGDLKMVAGAFMTFVNKLCLATKKKAIYIAPLDLFLLAQRVAGDALRPDNVHADKYIMPMPSLETDSLEPNLPVAAQYDHVTILKGTAIKKTKLKTSRLYRLDAFFADGKVANADSVITTRDVTLRNPYVLYSEDEEDGSFMHFIEMSPSNPIVIFIGGNPRKVIDGSIRCIVRPPIGYSETSLSILAAMPQKKVEAASTVSSPIDGDDDDSDDDEFHLAPEPPVVAQRKPKDTTMSLEPPHSIEQKGVTSGRKRPADEMDDQ